MFQKQLMRKLSLGIAILALPAMVFAETVGVFFNAAVPQDSFAAGDVKAAIESKGHTVEMLALSSLSSSYANKKVVLALASNTTVTGIMGGTAPTGLVEQAYALRTTTTPKTSYWVLGGDVNGTMYGGFQIAENIKNDGLTGTYNMGESPFTKERGAKINIPMDGRSLTYPGILRGEAFKRAIPNAWDINFWKEWFDAKARNRYNMLSIWCDHPFTHMVKVPGYEDCALADIHSDSVGTVLKIMTMDQKIAHWKQVMAYAHSRGFRFYIINWNTWTWGCTNKHGITNESDNTATMTYMAASMKKLLETYPDLDGFGITCGEMMDGSNDQKENFLWESYGKPVWEYAKANPNRKITFIHRFYQAQTDYIVNQFKPMFTQSNIKFSFSVKYSQAKMLSTTYPAYFTGDLNSVITNNLTTYLTLRTDDLTFLDWGDPTFARNYIKGIPNQNPAHRQYINGWYFGGDNWTPTRAFHVKDVSRQNELECKRNWYFDMVWGRLSYNPDISDDVFKKAIKLQYPQVDENVLFEAWRTASRAFQVGNEYLVGFFYFDYTYHPEDQKYVDGYRTAEDFKEAVPAMGSNLTSFTQAADSARNCAERALKVLNAMSAGGDPNLHIKIRNLQALACLSLFVSEKLRGAFSTGTAATTALAKAYCIWLSYAELMDQMHIGMTYQRTDRTPSWQAVNGNVLYDYENVGGVGTPTCTTPYIGVKPVSVFIDKKLPLGVRALSSRAITLYLPGDQGFSVEIFTSAGAKVAKLSKLQNTKGISRFALGKKLPQGVYLVRVKSAGQVMVRQMNVVTR